MCESDAGGTLEAMNESIVVGYDGSAESRDGLALGVVLAAVRQSGLVLVWVEPVGPLDVPFDAVLQPIQDRAEEALEEVAQGLRAQGVDVKTRVGLLGSAAQGIHELAEDTSASLVVVGSSHRGRAGRVLAGTVGTRLLQGSPCPVAIAPRGLADGPVELERFGVGYDGTPESQLALSWAERLASAAGASLELVVVSEDHSTDLIDIGREKRQRAEHLLADGLDRVTEVRARGAVKSGSALEHLARLSERVDLLVVGSRGYGPLRRVLLGSVSAHLAGHSDCPVVVTPRAAVEHRRAVSPAGAASTA
jgi:nucleotide-binding universal stress UspA family protein